LTHYQILLRAGGKIGYIGPSVGFENSKYFSQVFKKRTGMTPQQYRSNNQERRAK
jgi:two-component system response regulator YesN